MLKVLLRVFGVVAYEMSTCTSENLPLKVIQGWYSTEAEMEESCDAFEPNTKKAPNQPH